MLEAVVRTKGRAERKLEAWVVRELVKEDLTLLDGEKGVTPPPLMKRLSDRHHTLARNLASGMEHGEAAVVCGYDISRVSILLGDPTFKELVLFYRSNVDAQYAQLHEVLAGMAVDAALEIRERLEDDEMREKIPLSQLLAITAMGADRTGHGPSSTSEVNLNVGLSNRLEEARKRVEARRKMIDITPQEAAE